MTPSLRVCVLGLMLATPVVAQNDLWCQELWLSRNTVLERAGFCFQTPLGQAVFDDFGCIPGPPSLSTTDAEIVQILLGMEEESGCAVDTSATAIDERLHPLAERLTELSTVPIDGYTEHGCGGYLGPARDLHAGVSNEAVVIGRLEPGQNFSFAHAAMPSGWEYITVTQDGHRVAHGWVQNIEISDVTCEFIAG
ncbi:DUF4453 domain-containing protein [Gymnodinialimonas sp. 2305UL16-5]|uniref:DUF4453 domain-containing protein n=1 Tax=Gymnodinialimonas mytili TaxID=3126503 RepID=UPI0030A51CCD